MRRLAFVSILAAVLEAELDATPGGIYRVRVPQGFYAIGEFVSRSTRPT